jgi:hypothetical protein
MEAPDGVVESQQQMKSQYLMLLFPQKLIPMAI